MANKEMTATEKMRQKFANKALDTEQLDGVAGGTTEQNDQDLEFLRKLLNDPLPNEYSKGYQLIGKARAAEKGWAKANKYRTSKGRKTTSCFFLFEYSILKRIISDSIIC